MPYVREILGSTVAGFGTGAPERPSRAPSSRLGGGKPTLWGQADIVEKPAGVARTPCEASAPLPDDTG
jgi:hypothetical protein